MNRAPLVPVFALTAVLVATGCGAGKKVAVPNVKGKDPAVAYEVLHRAGLKVSILRPVAFTHEPDGIQLTHSGPLCACEVPAPPQFSGQCCNGPGPPPGVSAQKPVPGSSVASGSSIALTIRDWFGGGVSLFKCVSYLTRAPDFVGMTLREASAKAGACLSLVAQLPPLESAGKAHLLDNYVVIGESPAAGRLFIPPTSASNPPPQRVSLKVRAVS